MKNNERLIEGTIISYEFLLLNFTQKIRDIVNKLFTVKNFPVQLLTHFLGEISNYCINLISRTLPQMQIDLKPISIPNYEARAMSFILFSMKVLFGLDGKTEFYYSDLAGKINDHLLDHENNSDMKMFVFDSWLKYIEYRRCVLEEMHFPSMYLSEHSNDTNLFADFMREYNMKYNVDKELTLEMSIINDMLEKLKNSSELSNNMMQFKHSLTPYRNYTEILTLSETLEEKKYFLDLLDVNFENKTIDFAIDAEKYLRRLNSGISFQTKHGGVNDDIVFVTTLDKHTEETNQQDDFRKTIAVVFGEGITQENSSEIPKIKFKKYNEEDSASTLRRFEENNCAVYEKNMKRACKSLLEEDIQQERGEISNIDVDPFVYQPSERYWLYTQNVGRFTKDEFKNFASNFPLSFKLIFRECSRIIEQEGRDFFIEYNLTELYLCYVVNVRTGNFRSDQKKIPNLSLRKLINFAMKGW